MLLVFFFFFRTDEETFLVTLDVFYFLLIIPLIARKETPRHQPLQGCTGSLSGLAFRAKNDQNLFCHLAHFPINYIHVNFIRGHKILNTHDLARSAKQQ